MASTSSTSSKGPTEAMMVLMSPDGYYKYLNIPKPQPSATSVAGDHQPTSSTSTTTTEIDVDQVKKNYRRLSIKHHPDKPTGDADTFRLLTRAKVVLSTPKLRKQYDILGVDLDEDETDNSNTASTSTSSDGEGTADGDGNDGTSGGGSNSDGSTGGSSSGGLIEEIASMALTAILQVLFRTCILAIASLVVVRYRILLFPALAFLAYVAFRLHSTPGASSNDIIPPLLIATGLIIMYQASHGKVAMETAGGDDSSSPSGNNWLLYWLGESAVICVFIYNSVSMDQYSPSLYRPIMVAIIVVGTLAALWFRGKFWNYVLVIVLEAGVALFIAVVFPIFEMILEAVVNEKLKKVGEKVRAHHEQMERYYQSKMNK